jgi:hypothetical protein
MNERKLSATDAEVRQRITELGVHIPCGNVRGPLQRRNPNSALPVRWQSCPDEDVPEKWEDCDVSREYDLCIVCFRATAGGRSRWAWLACADCRAVNEKIGSQAGVRPFPLGRHSIMNGIGIGKGVPPEVADAQIARLVAFARGDDRLRSWQREEYGRLASAFDPLADIPLRIWQQQWPSSREASVDAFSRLLGRDLP